MTTLVTLAAKSAKRGALQAFARRCTPISGSKQFFASSVVTDINMLGGSSSPSSSSTENQFQLKHALWETYLETGQGATALFDCLVMDQDYSQTKKKTSKQSDLISASQLKDFLHEIDYQGINGPEWKELEHMNHQEEFDLQSFRTWIRHATHDWSVHV